MKFLKFTWKKNALEICTVEMLVMYTISEFIRIMSTKETHPVQITIPKSVLKNYYSP